MSKKDTKNTPAKKDNSMVEVRVINNYFDKLMPVLLGAIPSFRFHQARSIDLGTTEQCKGYENANDTPDDEVARGLLSKDAAEKLRGSYLMHISKLDINFVA